MAFVDSATHFSGKQMVDAVVTVLLLPFRMLDYIREADRMGTEATELLQLSDDQLAAMGLKRDQVVSHVFRATRDA